MPPVEAFDSILCRGRPVTKDEAIQLLKTDVQEWNRRRTKGEDVWIDLSNADLSGADLSDVDFGIANLSDVDFGYIEFDDAILYRVDLSGAILVGAVFNGANLSDADLIDALLMDADLSDANLSGANFSGADLSSATLCRVDLRGLRFTEAWMELTTFGNVDLSVAVDLDTVEFHGPCTVGVDTLVNSKGRIPDSFLRGCGFQKWQILEARLYDSSLTALEIEELQILIFNERTAGDAFIGGTFISYAHANAKFVDKLYDRLTAKGIPTWLDRHDLVAGPLQKQVDRAIRLNDVVLLVLSEASIESDWVEHEIKTARRKEKEQKREILCPIALDDAWKAKVLGAKGAADGPDVDWEHLGKKNVLDFAKWDSDAFDAAFKKLIDGLKLWYSRAPKASP